MTKSLSLETSHFAASRSELVSVSLYEGRAYDPNRFVRLMAVVNIVFACVVLFAWSEIAVYLDAPMAVASDAGIARRPDFSEYPYVLLWTLPILGSLGAWIAFRAEKFLFAKFLAAYPAIVIISAVFWYHYLSAIYA